MRSLLGALLVTDPNSHRVRRIAVGHVEIFADALNHTIRAIVPAP